MVSTTPGTLRATVGVPDAEDSKIEYPHPLSFNDIKEFKEKILYIVNNEDLFIKNSREFAENFTWERTVDMWTILLKDNNMKN